MTIRVFITGGTFDKEYDELTGKLFFKDTHVPEMLDRGHCMVTCERTAKKACSSDCDRERDTIILHYRPTITS